MCVCGLSPADGQVDRQPPARTRTRRDKCGVCRMKCCCALTFPDLRSCSVCPTAAHYRMQKCQILDSICPPSRTPPPKRCRPAPLSFPNRTGGANVSTLGCPQQSDAPAETLKDQQNVLRRDMLQKDAKSQSARRSWVKQPQ